MPDGDLEDLPHRAKQLALYPHTSGRHESVIKFGQWENAVASYLASVSFVDDLIGDLVKALDDRNLIEKTWIVLGLIMAGILVKNSTGVKQQVGSEVRGFLLIVPPYVIQDIKSLKKLNISLTFWIWHRLWLI